MLAIIGRGRIQQAARRRCRVFRGLTLIEMLVAMTVTLMLVYALVQLFSWVGEVSTKGRAMLEMSGQLRSITLLLQADLNGRTAPTLPISATGDDGYFEYVEGAGIDSVSAAKDILGDVDDRLAFTARRLGNDVYRGVYNDGTTTQYLDSPLAEVVWWVAVGANSKRNLYRRALLVRPDLNNVSTGLLTSSTDIAAFHRQSDISARLVYNSAGTAIGIAANRLEDLNRRGNRFAHDPAPDHHPSPLSPSRLLASICDGARLGEDVVYSDVYAFDVRAFDPLAPMYFNSSIDYVVAPSDPNYDSTGVSLPTGGGSDPLPPPAYLDDGSAALDGAWGNWPETSSYGGSYRNAVAGTGTITATWTFSGVAPGRYEVWATWFAHTNRATNAPFTVSDGGVIKGTYSMNQQSAPNDLADAGKQWERLGEVTITGTSVIVNLTNSANGQVIADAVRLSCLEVSAAPPGTCHGAYVDLGYSPTDFQTLGGGTPPPTPSTPVTLDIADSGLAGGTWGTYSATGAYGGSYRNAVAGTGAMTATWTFSSLPAGSYDVWVTWTQHTNRATNATYTILDGATSVGTATVNQQLAPVADVTDGGANFQKLGRFTISGTTLNVRLTNNANGQVIADGIRIQQFIPPPPPTVSFSEYRSWFSPVPSARSGLTVPTWDTWPASYENDGFDQDGDSLTDEGNNGIDDAETAGNAATILKGVDDDDERETAPPYNYPLLGIEVRIRAFEPDSRQVRQSSIVADFAPK